MTKNALKTGAGHVADVMSVAKSPVSATTIATGSCDTSVKLFDLRTSAATHAFHNHSADINSVSFMADGYTLACGSDDSTISIVDIRCAGAVGLCRNERINTGITSGILKIFMAMLVFYSVIFEVGTFALCGI